MSTELEVQRRLTKAFIDTKPETITFIPQVKVKTGSGVKTTLGTPRDPQIVRLNEPGDSGQRDPYRATDGIQRQIEYLIIAEWNAVLAIDDVFTYRGEEYTVNAVLHDNGYEVRGQAVRRGY